MRNNNEERRYRRIIIMGKMQATVEGDSGSKLSPITVPLKDFSKSGTGFYCTFEIPLKTLVKLSVLECGCAPLEGRVVWAGPAKPDDGAPSTHPYRIGVDFMPRDDEARENQLAVYNFISNFVGELEKK